MVSRSRQKAIEREERFDRAKQLAEEDKHDLLPIVDNEGRVIQRKKQEGR